ncbi:MAG: hypothetical protein HY814_02875 [Candidatus Riflebacteria bacterium]|nr:hypothetical protein [Candidatus Riflebacteria bacterium]
MLGAALLGMIPHSTEALPVRVVSSVVLLGFSLFFILERLLIWRHCHEHECDVHASSGALLSVGDSFHNFADGLVLAGAFLESTQLGLAAALSTIAHEVPQELGEFVVYLHGGLTRLAPEGGGPRCRRHGWRHGRSRVEDPTPVASAVHPSSAGLPQEPSHPEDVQQALTRKLEALQLELEQLKAIMAAPGTGPEDD